MKTAHDSKVVTLRIATQTGRAVEPSDSWPTIDVLALLESGDHRRGDDRRGHLLDADSSAGGVK